MHIKHVKHRIRALAATMLLLGTAALARAASVTFFDPSATNNPSSAVFTLSGGQLQITLSGGNPTLAPSTNLTDVMWDMGASPVLAVNSATGGQQSSTTFPISGQAVKSAFGFKSSPAADPNIWQKFASYSPKTGVSGPGLTPGVKPTSLPVVSGPAPAESENLSLPATTSPIMLTLPSEYTVLNNNQSYHIGTALQSPLAAGAFPAVGVPIPPAVWMGLSTLMGLAFFRKFGRRRIP